MFDKLSERASLCATAERINAQLDDGGSMWAMEIDTNSLLAEMSRVNDKNL